MHRQVQQFGITRRRQPNAPGLASYRRRLAQPGSGPRKMGKIGYRSPGATDTPSPPETRPHMPPGGAPMTKTVAGGYLCSWQWSRTSC